MPLYEYQCLQCNRTFEAIRKFSDPDLTKCSDCGGQLERLLSAPAIQFKGDGWYVNDYARKNGANGNRDKSSKETTATESTGTDSSAPAKSSSSAS